MPAPPWRDRGSACAERRSPGPGGGVAAAAASLPGARRVVGDRVLVGSMGPRGIASRCRARCGGRVRGKRLRARVGDLPNGGPAPTPARSGSMFACSRARGFGRAEPDRIHVDDALVRLEKFLGRCRDYRQRTLRVIHGFGPASCGARVGEFLKTHPEVATFTTAPSDRARRLSRLSR